MGKIPLSTNIYKKELFSKALNNRFNMIRARTMTNALKGAKYDFNYIAG